MDEREFEMLKEILLFELKLFFGMLFLVLSVALAGGHFFGLLSLSLWQLAIVVCMGVIGFMWFVVDSEELGRWVRFARYAAAKFGTLLRVGLGRVFKFRKTANSRAYGLTYREIAGKYLDFSLGEGDEG